MDKRERLSQLVLETLRELKRTAWSQTTGKAAEKRMPERGNNDMVKKHSYPINKLFTRFKNRRAGSQQGLMLWRHRLFYPGRAV